MRSWRSAVAAKVPPQILRAAAPLLTKSRRPSGRSTHPALLTSAGGLRHDNVLALRRFLDEFSFSYRTEVRDGLGVHVLDPLSITADEVNHALEASSLEVLQVRRLSTGEHAFYLSGQTTGHEAIDLALSARLLVPVQEATPGLQDALEISFDVDLVYTWVDGGDPVWTGQRHEAEAMENDPIMRTSNDDGRFATHDELRYSLRSVEYFAPWVRRIFIVTAGHLPAWLDSGDDRIHVVEHAQIFEDPAHLPTFNSHAIEAQLHRIPGLAEHFIYMNDDVFLGQHVGPGAFFTPAGQPRFYLSRQAIRREGEQELPVDIAAKNNRTLIEARFGRTISRKFKHAPHAQLRSTLELIASENPEAVARTAAARFRSATDISIPSSLAHYYGLCLGSAIPSEIGYAYTDVSQHDAQLRLLRMLWRGLPVTFCLNEVESRNDQGQSGETARMLAHFLPRAFPLPSSHELGPTLVPSAKRLSTGMESSN